ncbi:MAG: acetate--CoA ligase family protein [Burkholderiales bacterium]|nr:acetate--CoA ligase family protein [Burkholderiales bacterium]
MSMPAAGDALPPPRIDAARILAPRSVALIGASEDIGKFGGRILHNVLRHGFAGALLPINPNRRTVLGVPAYADIAAAPGPVDLAVIAVPAAQLAATVTACAQAGVGACVVITAQTAEFDAAGERLQREIVDIARRHGMRLVGPNCMGMISPVAGLGLTSSLTLQHVPRLIPGRVGLVSQSGALMATLFMLAHDHGGGFSRMVSVGNQADLELCDFFEALIADDRTAVICLYVEGIRDGRRFVRACARAADGGKPVLAVKAGRSDHGARAAASHTASMAGSYGDFAAACRAAGVVLMDEPEAMALVATAYDRIGDIGAGAIGMIVSSGGGGAVTADRLALADLPLAAYTEPTRAALSRHFLERHINNPVDLGSHKGVLALDVFVETIDAIVRAPEVAVVFYILTAQPLMRETAAALVDAWRTSRKPFVVVLDAGSFGDAVRDLFIDAGMPFLTRIDDGLRALALLFERRRLRAVAQRPAATRPAHASPLAAERLAALPSGRLTEPEAKALLRAYGIATPREVIADSAAAAARAAVAIGFPVVLKGLVRRIVHKSDAGLVRLGLSDAEAVRQAYAGVTAALTLAAEPAPESVSVQETACGSVELIVGARWTEYGPQVMAGFGGTLVELLRDVGFASAPVSRAAARELLAGLRLAPLFDGVRGRDRADIEAAADVIERVSWLAVDLGRQLVELDINPLIVGPRDAVAADARATLG